MPYPREIFGTLSEPFQWSDTLEIQTLVLTGTRKPEVPENQKTRKPELTPEVPVQISRGKT